MIVGAGDYITDNDRRASGGIDHIIVFGIKEKVVSYKRCRLAFAALAPQVDIIVIASLARKVTVLDQHIGISGMHALPD